MARIGVKGLVACPGEGRSLAGRSVDNFPFSTAEASTGDGGSLLDVSFDSVFEEMPGPERVEMANEAYELTIL